MTRKRSTRWRRVIPARAMRWNCIASSNFICTLQLREAAEYVHAQGLILKGDIAIGVYRHGADVWQQPELFHTDMQAGAPPDPFAAKGQNWGFPTYNWPRMKQDGFDWWKRRFAQMGNYFDAFRIDHILGFFRIWSIPRHAVEGILGYFVPAIPVQAAEFAARGIAFDRERFARPFINDAVLQEIFGERCRKREARIPESRRRRNLFAEAGICDATGGGKTFCDAGSNRAQRRLKEGLFDLISNVLLIEARRAAEFHFRLGMEQTASFRQLDPDNPDAAEGIVRGLFFPAAGRFLEARGDAKIARAQARDQHADLRRGPGHGAGLRAGRDEATGLLSLEIQRMPKALNVDFSRPADAPYLSVVTPSTHDMSTIRGWWQEDRTITQKFFNQELRQPGPAPPECEPWINQEIVRQHLESPAMWSIFQLQDLLGMDGDVAPRRRRTPSASTCRPIRIITGATACILPIESLMNVNEVATSN